VRQLSAIAEDDPTPGIALKPCPFCGCSNLVIERTLYGYGHYVGCDECTANVVSCVKPPLNSERDAREMWNRRTAIIQKAKP
jgi:Lar family restriction alleviation protein